MQTIRLRISDKVFDKFNRLLNEFGEGEIEIIEDDIEFRKNKEYLANELLEIENGNSIFLEEEEAYERLEKVIKKYENNL